MCVFFQQFIKIFGWCHTFFSNKSMNKNNLNHFHITILIFRFFILFSHLINSQTFCSKSKILHLIQLCFFVLKRSFFSFAIFQPTIRVNLQYKKLNDIKIIFIYLIAHSTYIVYYFYQYEIRLLSLCQLNKV